MTVEITEGIEIRFPDAGAADAGRLADDLGLRLRELDETAKTSVTKGSGDTMDFGSILVLIMGTASFTAIARGVADWIRKQGDPAIIIKRGKDEITIQRGLSSEQKFELAKLALEKFK